MLRYIGQGAAIIGVPARNLTDEEEKQYGRARLLKSGLYVQVRAKPHKITEQDPSPDDGDKE